MARLMDAAAPPLPSSSSSRPPFARLRLPLSRLTHERLLLVLFLIELLFFATSGRRFFTFDNASEIVRASAEVTLLALALTPVILTGGIDLSVGSLLGFCAVVLGMLWRDAQWPIAWAACAAIAAGLAGGVLNAWLIAWLRMPPLIVTLGTYSLFRGLAEGLTSGVRNYSNFPRGFLFLGQGDVGGAGIGGAGTGGAGSGLPVQLFVVAIAAVVFWVFVHRLAIGRTLRAIGFAPEGARYAGLAVARSTALVYALAGVTAGFASLLYVARLGQAKADAGAGFELTAITAIVLGGTSIFGGRGSIGGTLLGVAMLAVLQNGLRLADLPAELAGVLTALLLVVALGANRLFDQR